MEIKTVDDLRREYPALVDQIEQAAAQKAENNERQRIQDIEEMAIPGTEAVTAEAKFIKPVSASDYAKAAMKLIRNQGAAMMNGLQRDADGSGVNGVKSQSPQNGGADEFLDAIRDAGKKE